LCELFSSSIVLEVSYCELGIGNWDKGYFRDFIFLAHHMEKSITSALMP